MARKVKRLEQQWLAVITVDDADPRGVAVRITDAAAAARLHEEQRRRAA